MEKSPDISPVEREIIHDLPMSEKLELTDKNAKKQAIRRWYDLRRRASVGKYYRRLVRRSPNRLRDQQSFEAMGHMMIERSVSTESTSARRRLRRRELALKWRRFMDATIARW